MLPWWGSTSDGFGTTRREAASAISSLTSYKTKRDAAGLDASALAGFFPVFST